MNKIVIPAILVSITLVAGIFALMPIEKASTVHTTIQDTQLTVVYLRVGASEAAASDVVTISCDNSEYLVHLNVYNSVVIADGSVDVTSTNLLIDDLDTTGAIGVATISQAIGALANSDVVLTFTAGATPNETFFVTATILIPSADAATCTIGAA